MKLELKHLTPYLPYQLMVLNIKTDKLMRLSSISSLGFLNEKDYQFGVAPFGVDTIKPLLRPLSSMTKEEAYEFGVLLMGEADMEDKEVGVGCITLMGDTYPVIMYQDQEDEEYSVMVQFASTGMSVSVIDLIPYAAYEWLFKNHFDTFNLINNNLAIEKTK